MKTKPNEIIVITGTPGIGKTAVSKSLTTKLGAVHIDIGELVKQEKLITGYDNKRQTLIADTVKLARRLRQIAKEHQTTLIIDGHYAASVTPRSYSTSIFVLRCHPKKLRKRMEKRGFRGTKLWENLAAEVLDVCLQDTLVNAMGQKTCEIDTTNQTLDETVNEILSIYQGQGECTVGRIDWLGALEKEKSLDEYLRKF